MKLRDFVIIAAVAIASWDGTRAEDSTKKLTQAINEFGLKMYKELAKTNDNLFCSGYSFAVPLNMLLVGSRGTTADQIRTAMGYDKLQLPQNQVEDSLREILTEQRKNHTEYELDVANSMWIHSGYPVLEDFKSKIQNNFYAEEKQVSFGPPEATDAINGWVNSATKGRISKLFDHPLDGATRLVLVNAIYFKGTWETKFNKNLTSDYAFKFVANDNQQQKDIKMMNMVKHLLYTESDELQSQILEIPYDGDEVHLIVVLPFETSNLKDVESKLTVDNLKQALNNMSNASVRLRIPKFESSSTLPMNEVLQAMGIEDAFDSGKADLSGIDGTRNLYVTKAVQKAVVQVNEEGTVAAAGSGIAASIRTVVKPKSVVFIADRPFIYLIYHKPMGIIYFMGRYAQP